MGADQGRNYSSASQKRTFELSQKRTSQLSRYKRCLSKIHKTCFLQSGNVVLKRRAPYFLCSAFPALIGAVCRIRGQKLPPFDRPTKNLMPEPRSDFDSDGFMRPRPPRLPTPCSPVVRRVEPCAPPRPSKPPDA